VWDGSSENVIKGVRLGEETKKWRGVARAMRHGEERKEGLIEEKMREKGWAAREVGWWGGRGL